MITPEQALTPLTLCIFVLLLLGIAIFTWGKRLPGKGSWLLWAGLILILVGVGFDSGLFLKEEFRTKIWMAGWIWPRDEVSAITVGVFQDPLSLAMISLTACVVAILLMNPSQIFREPRPERIHAAVAISAAGVALAWNSLTPWLGLAGLLLTLAGGFISFGSRWDSNPEAKVAARFIGERASGFILAIFGACILATSRTALLFSNTELWSTQSDSLKSTWVGSTLLVVGLFIQVQPFPLLGWLVSSSEIYSPVRTLLSQIFPAWAAFALLVRLEPEFVNLGLFPGFGWVALVSTLLAVLSGLFQSQWRQGIGTWLAAGFSLSCALLAFSGPLPAMGMFLGISLSCLCLSNVGTALEGNCNQTASNKKRAIWVKVALFLGTSAGSGVIGFVSATGGLRWITQAMGMAGGLIALILFIFFLYVLLGWKLAWKIVKLGTASEVSWLTVLSLFMCVLFSLGFLWTGSATGDVLLGAADRLVASGFGVFFGAKAIDIANPDEFLSASGLYWSVLIVAFVTAYWTAGRKEDQWVVLARFIPNTSRFLAHGYGQDEIARRGIEVISGVGRFTEQLVDIKIWTRWIPNGLSTGIKAVTGAISVVDSKISLGIGAALRTVVDVPAKLLQLIQIGDVRWYLFFALSSGFALLAHFLKM